MPVEIRELIIRAVAQPDGEHPHPTTKVAPAAEEHDAIVAAAVREVLRILKAAKER